MFFRLVDQHTEKEGVTETLKADNQMLCLLVAKVILGYPKAFLDL